MKTPLKFKGQPSRSQVKGNSKKIQKNESAEVEQIQMTEAELAFLTAKQRREKQRFQQQLKTTHREKITKFNQLLGKMPEHNDIPRVTGAV